MSDKKREKRETTSIEGMISRRYEDAIRKLHPDPTDTDAMKERLAVNEDQRIRQMIEMVNSTYSGQHIDDFQVVDQPPYYDVVLGMGPVAIVLQKANTFYGEEQPGAGELEQMARKGWLFREISYSPPYFTLVMSDATVTEDLIMITKNAQMGRRRNA
jgi:hypothetical protein